MRADAYNGLKLYTKNGAPGVTRTHDTQIRNLVLYPPELRGHGIVLYQKISKMQVFLLNNQFKNPLIISIRLYINC